MTRRNLHRSSHAVATLLATAAAALTLGAPGQVPPDERPGATASAEEAPAAAAITQAQGPTASTRAAPILLLMADGSLVSGRLAGLDADGVTIVGEDDAARRVRWSECAGLVSEARIDASVALAFAVATLTSGERIPGQPEVNASGMRWIQRWLGPIELANDRIRWLSFDGRPPVPALADADVVRLANGDRIEGFVSRLADPLAIEPRQAGGDATSIPLGSIQSISFVSVAPAARAGVRRIWLVDGSILDAASITLADERLHLEGVGATGGKAEIPVAALLGIGGDRPVAALARQPMTTEANDQSAALRYEITPPDMISWPSTRRPMKPLGTGAAGTVDLDEGAWVLALPSFGFDGPGRLRVQISEAARLSARVVLPPDRRPHGDLELVVRSDGRELARHRLNAADPTFELLVDVTPPSIDFEIVDTGGGAVQDGIIIERAALVPMGASPATPPASNAPPASR